MNLLHLWCSHDGVHIVWCGTQKAVLKTRFRGILPISYSTSLHHHCCVTFVSGNFSSCRNALADQLVPSLLFTEILLLKVSYCFVFLSFSFKGLDFVFCLLFVCLFVCLSLLLFANLSTSLSQNPTPISNLEGGAETFLSCPLRIFDVIRKTISERLRTKETKEGRTKIVRWKEASLVGDIQCLLVKNMRLLYVYSHQPNLRTEFPW